ncbi:hypothetical protein I4641_03020 [Waterburya agarophytonicola K14]|uniref:Uncharacterized protein n=1 Tax=Waterburya agarophytonicola KI4 TaxID=2874699 RepID=A0A964BPH8_9CYAN|nr:hypothetical protein [Waterburya agarophytonicola]MCC0175952.1 hypothetical protein [Waterburya agarophytonicola KI4]
MRSSQVSEQFELPVYNLSAKRVTRFLLSIIALLVLFNLTERVIVYWFNATNGTELISHYFNFDQESNFPSLYSALALGFCSYLLAIITTFRKTQKAKYVKHWKALSFIFLFLAFDEACSIHELLIPILRGAINAKGILYFTWVIPAFFLLIVFLIAFRKFIQNLPTKTRTLFILAGAVYVGGALGMELVGGYIADNYGYTTIYGIASSIEELLEMFGIVIFINGLLSYIQSQLSELHFSLSFKSSSNKMTSR